MEPCLLPAGARRSAPAQLQLKTPTCVRPCRAEGATNGHRGCLASVRLHGCGTLLLHASRPPASAKVDGVAAVVEYDAACQAVRVEVPEEASMSRGVVLLF